jgi:isopentenyldiphosphate isomerase
MLKSEGKLNIVDDNGNVIGEDTRENIHKKGSLHQEIHVWFYTPEGEIIFQHRAKNKDTWPDMLDATVGGHVEIGSGYERTAIQETREETGIRIKPDQLKYIKTLKNENYDTSTGKINNVLRASMLLSTPAT